LKKLKVCIWFEWVVMAYKRFFYKVITLHKFINLKHYYYLIMLNNQRKVSKSIYLVYFTSQDILHIYKTIIFHYQYFIKMDANKCKGIFIYLFIWNILHGNLFYMDYGKLITCKIHFTRPTFRQVWEKITEALRVRERESFPPTLKNEPFVIVQGWSVREEIFFFDLNGHLDGI